MAFSVMNHLSNWLQRPRMGNDKFPTFWPSSAGAVSEKNEFQGTCRRQVFLQYLMPLVSYSNKTDHKWDFWKDLVEEAKEKCIPFNKYQLWLFKSGDIYEEYVIDLAKESGIFIAEQVPVYIAKYNISGKIDYIGINPHDNKLIINEVKSVYSFGADEVLGKNFDRYNNFTGVPRTKNLMQIALYQWYFADERFENGRLQYGDRGTGKYAEYEIAVNKESGVISWRCIDPIQTNWINADYTVFDILKFYEEIQNNIESGVIPKRDYSLVYNLDYLEKIVEEEFKVIELDKEDNELNTYNSPSQFIFSADGKKGRKFQVDTKKSSKLSKSTAEQFIKHKDRLLNGGRQVKAPEDGDFQCEYCSFKNFCYDENKQPRKD